MNGALERLRLEECDAWFEYAAATAADAVPAHRYEEVEPFAWARLQAKLGAVRARRKALKRPARAAA